MSASLEGQSLNNRYRLLARIATGARSDVWDAYDVKLSRPVAIKIANVGARNNSSVVKAFRDEAATAAGLNHHNIVETFDAGIDTIDDQTVPYIVMERIYGKTLRQALRNHPFSEPEIRRIGYQLCDAASYLHSRGVIHTDIKPTNVLVTGNPAYPDSRVVLTDFGLATQLLKTKTSGTDESNNETKKIRGGTAAYIAPELISGETPAPQCDIYSIGAVLYELAGDTAPILEETEQATIAAKLAREALPIRTLRPNLSEELAQTIDRCIKRDPSQRFESAHEVANQLIDQDAAETIESEHRIEVDHNAPTPPYGTFVRPRLPRKSRKPLAIIAFVSVLAVGLAVTIDQVGGFNTFAGRHTNGQLSQLPVNAIQSFDPQGDQQENDSQLPNLDDNNPTTVWSTSHYNSRSFGGLKSGVGVVFQVNATKVSRIVLSGISSDASVQIFTSTQPQTSLSDWGPVAGQATVTTDPTTVDITPIEAGAVLVWITDLGPTNKASIGEVQIFG